MTETANTPSYNIAVLPGDGIGPEIIPPCLNILEQLSVQLDGFRFEFQDCVGGAGHYRDTGEELPAETWAAVKSTDAILFGAMGLPEVRKPDGTEINPQIDLRMALELFAGVRRVRSIPGVPVSLSDPRAQEIDFVLIREQTEGMFADFTKGVREDNERAIDRCVITRAASERVFDFSFNLARTRKEQGFAGKLTCVDKANVLNTMAFFREIFNDRATQFSDIETESVYVDAMALNLVRAPWQYDVIVAENLMGDILSDLAASLVGGMGFAPSGDIGHDHAMFQPAHGSAPDIAGSGKANPTAMLLSASMMLDWLGTRHNNDALVQAGSLLERAVIETFKGGKIKTAEFGGTDRTETVTATVLNSIEQLIQTPA
ncbi:MAG: isocitrate/isopropylmalate dehydrogenase family protein [Rhodospirillaceae bacterium]|jgi:3-isopropylmalate dehydrogenase